MIDLRVMNDLADNKKRAVFEDFPRRISEVDGSLDSVAKAKLFCQAHRCIADGNHSTGAAHFLDDIAAIVRLHLLLHRCHDIRRAEIHLLARSCAAGNQVRTHIVVISLSAAKNSRLILFMECQNKRQRRFQTVA